MLYLVILSVVLIFIYFLLMISVPYRALYVCFLIKPIMDMSYSYSFAGGLTLGRILSVLVVFNMLFVIIKDIGNLFIVRGKYFVFIWILLSLLSFSMSGVIDFVDGLEALFRYMNFLLPFLAMPFLIRRDVDLFFAIIALASILPIAIAVLQIGGFQIGYFENTIGSLVRARGFFHDIFTNRLYFLYGIVGSVYFIVNNNSIKIKIFSITLYLLSSLSMFFMFSKSGYIILTLFFILLVVNLNLKFKFIAVIPVIIAALFFLFISFDTITAVYQKEINFILGNEKIERLFQGRVFGWKDALENWIESSALEKFFGQGAIASGMHNDFLRILVCNGLLGLFLHILFLGYIFVKLFFPTRCDNKFINQLSMVLFVTFMVDSIGLVPTLYPAYNWLVWGIFSYSLTSGHFLKKV